MEDREREKVTGLSQLNTKSLSYIPPEVVRVGTLNVGMGDCAPAGSGDLQNCNAGSNAVANCIDNGNTAGGGGVDGNCQDGLCAAFANCQAGCNAPDQCDNGDNGPP